MAHLSATFSHALPGKLQIVLTGTFHQGSHRDAGFPGSTPSAANMLVRGFVGPSGASRKYTEPIDRYAPAAVLQMDYPGGDESWPFGTETVDYLDPVGGGLWSYGIDNLNMTVVLRKK